MKTPLLLITTIVLAGCGESQSVRSSTAATPAPAATPPQPAAPAATPAQPAAPGAAAPAPPKDELHGFAPHEVIAVAFDRISEKGYPMVTLTNLTGRDIDDISGSFRLLDADGTILQSTGLTIAVPGDLFIAAGATRESSPFGLNRRAELMERLATAPEELSFAFEARSVTFMNAD